MRRPLHRERGVASIEMAIILVVSIVILVMIVLAGRLTWHATVLTKSIAATDRIVATLPRAMIVGGPVALGQFVKTTVFDTTRSAGLDIQPNADLFTVTCGGFACADFAFTSVTVTAGLNFRDTIFNANFQEVYAKAFLIHATATQTYATTTPKVPNND